MKPCKKCGVTDRNSRGVCIPCDRANHKARRQALKGVAALPGSARTRPCVKCSNVERNGRGDCIPCSKAYQKEWFQNHSHKAYKAGYKKEWLAANPDRSREFDLQVRVSRYGLTIDQYRQMCDRQSGLCCICARPFGRGCIDHDHDTGRVRGILCHTCNVGLGQFQDNPMLLARAIQYLKEPEAEAAAAE